MAVTVVSWGVTPTDVTNVTGASATAANIAMADSIVTIVANRSASASGGMSVRDINWVQHAICWQARWLAGQPGMETRNEFESMSQDGLSVQSRAQWSKYLAPLAARALRNLSSKGARTDAVEPISVPTGLGGAAFFLTEEGDQFSSGWEDMPI